MALADTAELVVKLTLAGNFKQQIAATQKSLKGLGADLTDTQGRAYKAGQQIGTGIKNAARIGAIGVAFLGSQVLFGLKQLSQLETLTAQTNAVIKSTGSAARISAEGVRALAEKYENLNAIIDDKVIQSGENLLLTFTNIKQKAFEPTLQAALDMSTALGQDLNTSVLQLGKALSDPAKGLLALRRAGVIFSKDQEKRIKSLQKEGKLWEAQQLILAEVGKEFGGSFAAQGKTAEGAIAGIGDAVEDLQKSLATALFPTIQKVLPQLRAFLVSPQFTKGAEDLGKAIAGVFSDDNIAAGADIIKSVFATAQAAAPVVAAAAKTMAGIVQTAVSVFRTLPPEIQALAVGAFAVNKLTGGLVTNIAGALTSSLIKNVLGSFTGGMNVTAGNVIVNGANVTGGGGLGGPAAAAGGLTGAGLNAAGIGVVIIGVTQAAAASLTKSIVGKITGDPNKANVAESVQQNVGGGPLNIFAPFERIMSALNGDLRSPLEKIETNTGMVSHHLDLQTASHAALQNVANERAEAIRAAVAAGNASRIADSGSERAAIAATSAGTIAALHGDSASEQSAIRTAAAAQTAATRSGLSDTRSEMAATRRAVQAQKLNVDVKVVNENKVSVQQIVKQTNIINKYTTIS